MDIGRVARDSVADTSPGARNVVGLGHRDGRMLRLERNDVYVLTRPRNIAEDQDQLALI
jgi:hypothetical protein